MKRTVILTVSLLALAALAVAAPAVQAKGDPGTRIALKSSGAFPGASGKAKFQNQDQRELEIEVEHVRRLAGRRVNFFVNSTKLVTLALGAGYAKAKSWFSFQEAYPGVL